MVKGNAPAETEQEIANQISFRCCDAEGTGSIPKQPKQEAQTQVETQITKGQAVLAALVLPDYPMVLQVVEDRQSGSDGEKVIEPCKYQNMKSNNNK